MNLAHKIISTAESLSSTPKALFGSQRLLQIVYVTRSLGLASSKPVVTQIGRSLNRMELKEPQERWPAIAQSDVICREVCVVHRRTRSRVRSRELSSRLTS